MADMGGEIEADQCDGKFNFPLFCVCCLSQLGFRALVTAQIGTHYVSRSVCVSVTQADLSVSERSQCVVGVSQSGRTVRS